MKKELILAALLLSSSAQAVTFDDGSQWALTGKVVAVAITGSTWIVTGEGGGQVIGDETTPTAFRGSSRMKSVRDVPIGAAFTVNWCIGHQGMCDTRQSTMPIYGIDPSEVSTKVTFEVGKDLKGRFDAK